MKRKTKGKRFRAKQQGVRLTDGLYWRWGPYPKSKRKAARQQLRRSREMASQAGFGCFMREINGRLYVYREYDIIPGFE